MVGHCAILSLEVRMSGGRLSRTGTAAWLVGLCAVLANLSAAAINVATAQGRWPGPLDVLQKGFQGRRSPVITYSDNVNSKS
jgi:hypothetical protein